MMFSRSELILIHHLANGLNTVDALKSAMGLGQARIYRIVADLKRKGILDPGRGVRISSDAFALRLLHLMEPSAKRADVLADSGMAVLMELRSPRSVDDVVHALGVSRATVYRHISTAMSTGAVIMDGDRYVLNERMWKGLRETLDSLADLRAVSDPRVIRGAVIYRSTREGVLYSYPEVLDDQKAAFSLFGEYGFDISLSTVYYTTRPGPSDIDRVFDDAYSIAKADGDSRLKLVLVLFYLSNEGRIRANPEFLSILKHIRNGEHIDHWPTLIDVESRISYGMTP